MEKFNIPLTSIINTIFNPFIHQKFSNEEFTIQLIKPQPLEVIIKHWPTPLPVNNFLSVNKSWLTFPPYYVIEQNPFASKPTQTQAWVGTEHNFQIFFWDRILETIPLARYHIITNPPARPTVYPPNNFSFYQFTHLPVSHSTR